MEIKIMWLCISNMVVNVRQPLYNILETPPLHLKYVKKLSPKIYTFSKWVSNSKMGQPRKYGTLYLETGQQVKSKDI
jgi:hypothetical protein